MGAQKLLSQNPKWEHNIFSHESLEMLHPTERCERSVGLEDGMKTRGGGAGTKYPNLFLLLQAVF